jgi:hypothetical protein
LAAGRISILRDALTIVDGILEKTVNLSEADKDDKRPGCYTIKKLWPTIRLRENAGKDLTTPKPGRIMTGLSALPTFTRFILPFRHVF